VEVLAKMIVASLEQLSGRAPDFAGFIQLHDIEEHPDLDIYVTSIDST